MKDTITYNGKKYKEIKEVDKYGSKSIVKRMMEDND